MILDKLNLYEQEVQLVLVESGIRNISKLAKKYSKAVIYFHKDL